jgi:hypothetical protein
MINEQHSDTTLTRRCDHDRPARIASVGSGLRKMVRVGVVGVMLPILLSFVAYYGYFTNYVGGTFHREGFRNHYENGLYRYRVLGKVLVLDAHRVVVSQTPVGRFFRRYLPELPRAMLIADPKGDKWFYGALFIANTLFLVATALTLYAILCSRENRTPLDYALAMGRYAMGLLPVVMTQYVPTPYDPLSYFFLLAGIYCVVCPFRWSFPIMLICMLLGALTRETMALLLVFFLAYHIGPLLRFDRRAIIHLVGLTGVFLMTYVTLRACYGTEHAVWQVVRWRLNLQDGLCILGFLLLPALSWLILSGVAQLGRCRVFLAASIPYVLAMATIANTWETRLWVPVWLGLLVLAHLDTRAVAARAAL